MLSPIIPVQVKVFISYRREDSIGHTGRLYDSLQSHFGADRVFMDLSGIDSGQNFVDVIQTAIRSSDVFLAVIGREWLTCAGARGRRLDDPNDFVRTEIATALGSGTPIIPVLVDGTSMPGAASLPDVLKPLSKRDAHELSDERWSYDVGRLIVATEKLAGKTDWWKRRSWLSVAAALVIVAILGGAYFFLGRRAPAPVRIAPSASLAGDWVAEVTYSWGAKYTERFRLKIDGNDVLGTASFLGSPRGIVGGSMSGDRVRFETRTQEILGDKTSDVVHSYRGTLSGDGIAFYMQTEGGSSTVPIEFTASRVRP
jgi:TIR domain